MTRYILTLLLLTGCWGHPDHDGPTATQPDPEPVELSAPDVLWECWCDWHCGTVSSGTHRDTCRPTEREASNWATTDCNRGASCNACWCDCETDGVLCSRRD